jgi:uncharacterized membrane protein YphA (DoxX/SURF4 family)
VTLSRRIARPLLASAFIGGGVDTLRDPAPRVKASEQVSAKLAAALGLPDDPEMLVKVNAGVQVGAGILLTIGKFRRLAALLLIGSILPTTWAGHRFWEHEDAEEREQQRMQFLKNLAMLGGLILELVDSEGAPSLGWRARRAARRASVVFGSHAHSEHDHLHELGDHVHGLADRAGGWVGEAAGLAAAEAAAGRAVGHRAAATTAGRSKAVAKAAATAAKLAAEYANRRGVEVSHRVEEVGHRVEGAWDPARASEVVRTGQRRAAEVLKTTSGQAANALKTTSEQAASVLAAQAGHASELLSVGAARAEEVGRRAEDAAHRVEEVVHRGVEHLGHH